MCNIYRHCHFQNLPMTRGPRDKWTTFQPICQSIHELIKLQILTQNVTKNLDSILTVNVIVKHLQSAISVSISHTSYKCKNLTV